MRKTKFEGYTIPTSDKAEWYCLLTFDNRTIDGLKIRLAKDQKELDLIEVYCPKKIVKAEVRGKIVKREDEPFGFYVFIKAKMSPEMYYAVIGTPGLSWLNTDIQNLKLPPAVPEEEIERVKREFAIVEEEVVNDIKVGQDVEITDGPLKGNIGVVTKVSDTATVKTEMFKRTIEVDVKFSQLQVIV